MTRILRRRLSVVLGLITLAITFGHRMASADTSNWIGASGAAWNSATSWDKGAIPPADGTADIAFTGSVGATSNAVSSYIHSLSFTNTLIAYIVQSNQLTIGGGGITSNDTNLTGPTISSDILCAGPQTWTVSSLADLNLSGAVNVNDQSVAVDVESLGTMNWGGSITGAGNIILNGNGTVNLTGSLASTNSGSGIVDASDYIVWRKGLGTTFTQSDYDVWRAHFGQTAGSGSGVNANVAVPEPVSVALLMLAVAGICAAPRRTIL